MRVIKYLFFVAVGCLALVGLYIFTTSGFQEKAPELVIKMKEALPDISAKEVIEKKTKRLQELVKTAKKPEVKTPEELPPPRPEEAEMKEKPKEEGVALSSASLTEKVPLPENELLTPDEVLRILKALGGDRETGDEN